VIVPGGNRGGEMMSGLNHPFIRGGARHDLVPLRVKAEESVAQAEPVPAMKGGFHQTVRVVAKACGPG